MRLFLDASVLFAAALSSISVWMTSFALCAQGMSGFRETVSNPG